MNADQEVLDTGSQGLETVLDTDLLAFVVGAAQIADRHLEDHPAALGRLGGELDLDREVVRSQRQRLEKRGAEHLVAGFDVGEIQIGEPVAQESDQAVAEMMLEVEDAAPLAGEKARSENHICAAVEEGSHQKLEVPGVVFEIGVLNHD